MFDCLSHTLSHHPIDEYCVCKIHILNARYFVLLAECEKLCFARKLEYLSVIFLFLSRSNIPTCVLFHDAPPVWRVCEWFCGHLYMFMASPLRPLSLAIALSKTPAGPAAADAV
jgi:hypothetical protein